ncbi:MAG: DUF3108 domain-containing protein [Sulfuricella sp.]|jgi:hypothetical protein|nr:DUF3108 domain-containing protein [Sulfuricella sp.]
MMRILLFLLLSAFLTGIALAAPPQQLTARYRVIKSGQLVGEVNEHFERNGQQYRIVSTTTATGIFALFARGAIRIQSTGEITREGLRPLHFEHHRGADPAKLIVADFDWEKHVVSHKYDGKVETAPLLPGTQDRLSQLYQFMFQAPGNHDMDFNISTGRKLSIYHYRFVKEETTAVSAGTFETLHLSKERSADEDGIELWLAKSQHYFPVRIVFDEKNGSRLEQQLESFSFKPD